MIENGLAERLKRPALLALALYTLLLLAGTHVPQPPDELMDLAGSDKRLHFAAYGVLALLAGLNLALRGLLRPSTALLLWAALAGFGALDEITQPLVGRQAEWNDWWADLAGLASGLAAVVLGLVAYRRWVGKRPAN